MTNYTDLLERLSDLDVRLTLDGEHLTVNAPKGTLSAELRDELGRCKEGMKAHLRVHPQRSAAKATGIVEIVRVPRVAHMPVSHTQRRLWFLKQIDPSSSTYNITICLRMTGTLDITVLERVLADLVERHESLRTRFVDVDGTPRCSVESESRAEVKLVDLSHLDEAAREDAARLEALAAAREPFDLTRCPLLHVTLVRLAAQQHLLCLVVDHIIADGISVNQFLSELQVLYTRYVGGTSADLPTLTAQYLDYAEWQRQAFAAGALDTHLAYWKQQLNGLPPMLQLPADRPRPPVQTANGARMVSCVSADLTAGLKALARREHVTLYMVLLAVFELLLHRYSGEEDFAVGSAVGARSSPEIEHVMGFFANNIVHRADLSGDPTVQELLVRVCKVAFQAYAHQDMPFDRLVEELAPRRAADHSPLFQVLFALHNPQITCVDLPNLICETEELPLSVARFDLAVDVFDIPEGLRVYLEYNSDLFDATTIERMSAHYQNLLVGFVGDPQSRAKALPMLDDAECQQMLSQRGEALALAQVSTLHGLFEIQAAHTPAAEAVRFEDHCLSYAELNAHANLLARHLLGIGASTGSLVGIWMERSTDMVVAMLAVLKVGAAYVPLDPSFPRERIDFMVADAGLAAIVSHGSLAAAMARHGVPCLAIDAEPQRIDALDDGNLAPTSGPDDVAYVIYTSGSTGKPKGVQIEHHSVVNFLRSMQREPGIGPDDRFVAATTLSFDIAGLEIHGPLICGGTVVLSSRATAVDGLALAELLDASQATILQATPATWRLLLESGWRGRAGLKMLCGGEALPRELAQRLLALGGELWNMYGPTETTIWSTVFRVTDAGASIPIGRPIADTSLFVLEPCGQPAPIGVAGELCIGGAGVARGYLNRPELTAEKFTLLSVGGRTAERVYRTGDLARIRHDGQLEFIGRLDHQVKIRGFRIELGEIETVLGTHEAVRQCVVVAREAAPDDLRLVAYVVYQPGEDLTVSEVRRHLRKELPDYMIPSVVVALETVPLTPNGKVDRKALLDPFKGAMQPGADYQPPAQGTEQQLAQIWRDVLQVERVGAEDNFFELGGHSLLSLRVAAAVHKAFDWRMDPRLMFFQNLRQIAAGFPDLASARREDHSDA